MSMDVTLVCDGPTMPGGAAPAEKHVAWVRDGYTSPRDARRQAALAHGWERWRGLDLCPACASRHLSARR